MQLSSFVVEFWAILALTLPLSSAILVVALQISGWRGSEEFASRLITDNWVVVVLVQLVSQTLGLILVSALCTIVKIHLRTLVAKSPLSLEKARFLNALSQSRPLRSNRAIFILVTTVAAILSTVPGALWAGAISPELHTNIVHRHVHIPFYSDSFIRSYVAGKAKTGEIIQNDKGFFSDDSNLMATLLLNSAQQASNKARLHPKLDNTGYTYIGRNFGTGSLVGFEHINRTVQPLAYTYFETGIVADTYCFRNTSSAFGIAINATSLDAADWPGTTGYVQGFWANGNPVIGFWLFGSEPGDLFAIAAPVNVYGERQANISVASVPHSTDRMYTTTYNQTQCKVNFTPHKIRLDVNVTAQTITTTRLGEVPWPDYGDFKVQNTVFAPAALSITDNAFGGSRVERAMRLNTEVLYNATYGNFPSGQVPDDILFQSIADFMTDVLDNSMVITGAYQSQYFNSSERVAAKVTVPSVVFGHELFQYIMLALTMLVAIFCMAYITAKGVWTSIVQVDFTDVSNVVLNASKGGTSLFHNHEEKGRIIDTAITLADPCSQWPGIVRASSTDEEGRGNAKLAKPASDVSPASNSLSATGR